MRALENLKASIAAAVAVCALITMSVQAAPYREADVLRQSKTCEAALRLPWGDIDGDAWADCMKHQRVRSPEERQRDENYPRTPWGNAFGDSQLNATAEGCQTWALKQPAQPSHPDYPLSSTNHAWNICMEQQRIFTTPLSRKMPDFHAMVTEQRTMTIAKRFSIGEIFGCHSQDYYLQVFYISSILYKDIQDTYLEKPFSDAAYDASRKRKRELIVASNDCRFFSYGDRVQVKEVKEAESKNKPDLLCLVPVGSTGPCYWTHRNAINAWE
jgi:hypothetical protein